MSDFCRFYPAYTIDRAVDELTGEQIRLFLNQAYKRPWAQVVLVDP